MYWIFRAWKAARFILEQRSFDVRQMIDDALDMLALRAYQKHLRILSWISNDVPAFVRGDDGRIAQILINLVSNALKFTERGYILLSVEVQPPDPEEEIQPSEEDSILLRFSIKDTGLGIPLDRQGALFQAFSQVDTTSSRRHGGTGLGLAISKQLVELMDGEIHLSSKGVPGEGSTFTFTVRVQVDADQSLPYLEADQPFLTGKQILIVDSMPYYRSILEEQLTFWGMQVDVAENPPAASAWLASGHEPQLAMLSYSDMERSYKKQAEMLIQSLTMLGVKLILTLDAGKGLPSHLANHAVIKLPASCGRLYKVVSQAVQPSTCLEATGTAGKMPADISRRDQAILLVDDDQINRDVLGLILQNLGYDVDLVTNGFMALQTLESKNYPVIIMDQQMPEMDGMTAIRGINQVSGPDNQPFIIALTADARSEIHQSLRERALRSPSQNRYRRKR